MARGWESKSVEEQQAEAISQPHRKTPTSPEEVKLQRQKEALVLSRQRVIQQLEQARHPHHRQMLTTALADLEARLARLG